MKFLDYLHSRGETTYSLAAKSGISVRTIEQYTAGRNRLANARAHIVIRMADALGVQARDLIALDEPQEIQDTSRGEKSGTGA